MKDKIQEKIESTRNDKIQDKIKYARDNNIQMKPLAVGGKLPRLHARTDTTQWRQDTTEPSCLLEEKLKGYRQRLQRLQTKIR